jgi:hypothetical protein
MIVAVMVVLSLTLWPVFVIYSYIRPTAREIARMRYRSENSTVIWHWSDGDLQNSKFTDEAFAVMYTVPFIVVCLAAFGAGIGFGWFCVVFVGVLLYSGVISFWAVHICVRSACKRQPCVCKKE